MTVTLERTLTEFGATVLSIMHERGITSQAKMVELLGKQGLKIGQPGFSNWLYGKTSASNRFPRAFVDALNLDEVQKARLAHAFCFGQNRHITMDF